MLTFRSRFDILSFHQIEPLSKLTDNTPILFINQHNMAMPGSISMANVSLAWRIVGRIVWTSLLSRLFCCSTRRFRTLCKRGALGNDGLKGVNVLLGDFSKLYSRKGATVWAKVPSWDEIALWGLMEDLGGRWKGKVELWREVKMEVKVFFWGRALRVGS